MPFHDDNHGTVCGKTLTAGNLLFIFHIAFDRMDDITQAAAQDTQAKHVIPGTIIFKSTFPYPENELVAPVECKFHFWSLQATTF